MRHISFKKPAALLVLALVLLAYSNSFNAEFHFDDVTKIYFDPFIRDVSNIPHMFVGTGDGYVLKDLEFRPVTYSSLVLNYIISGYHTWSYHLFNLVLHIINSLLVFLAVRMVAGHGRRGGEMAELVALASASLFALHPLQTSTVMYLSNGRSVMLAVMFYLLAFIGFVRFREGGKKRPAALAWGMSSLVFFMLGMMSKEITVTLPAVMILYDLLFTVRERGERQNTRRMIYFYLPVTVVLAVFMLWKQSVQGYIAVRETPYAPVDYLMSEAKALLLYLRLILLPFNQNADYYLSPTSALDVKTTLGAAVAVSIVALVFRLRKKEPVTAFFGAWFLVTMLPESSVVSFKNIAVEYRLYLPLAGFITAAVSIGVSRFDVEKGRAVAALFAVVLVLFGVLCFNRNAVYRTEVKFWSDVASKSPLSSRAHGNLGRALIKAGDFNGAYSELTASLELDPDNRQEAISRSVLGMYYYDIKDYENAVKLLEMALDVGDVHEIYNKLGESYFMLGRYVKSADAFRRALEVGHEDTATQYNLAIAMLMDGQTLEAAQMLEELLENGLDTYDLRYSLAIAYQKEGRKDEAAVQAGIAAGMARDEQERQNAEDIISGH